MAPFPNRWLNIYHEYNQDLTQHEVLLVGEYQDKKIKWACPIPSPITDEGFNHFIKKLNVMLDDVHRLDSTP